MLGNTVRPRGQRDIRRVGGKLDSFTFYVLNNPNSQPLPTTGTGDIELSFYSGSAGFTGSTLLGNLQTISVEDVAASSTVSSEFNFSFAELTVDLSGFDIDAMIGDTFSITKTVSGTGGYQIIGTGQTSGTNYGTNPGFAPFTNRTFSTIGPGGIGSVAFSNSYKVFVDDGATDPMSPVPLPAGLPLMLAGLGAFGLLRRYT
ncbi:MAG: VPLPA-CTERM sorting domain-containing protein [Pseudomonadota bacterium]